MQLYIGTKLVGAEPQECQKDNYLSKKGDPGYKVEYEDGYVSWSPAVPFEKAYRRADGMSFGMALEALKVGRRPRLPHWKEDVCLVLQRPDSKSKMTHPYIYVMSRFGMVPWVATQVEMLSDQWQVAQAAICKHVKRHASV